MICKTCGIKGHDSQGSKELCLVAVIDRCRNLERNLWYVCNLAERLGPKAHNTHREEALAMLDGTVAEARELLPKNVCRCGKTTFIKALHEVGCPKRY